MLPYQNFTVTSPRYDVYCKFQSNFSCYSMCNKITVPDLTERLFLMSGGSEFSSAEMSCFSQG